MILNKNKESFMRFIPGAFEKARNNKAAGVHPSAFLLPEKILQFGSGVLLRELSDFSINKANKEGILNGRLVVVNSTSNSNTGILKTHDASISRVLFAKEQWPEILACASNPDLGIIISNNKVVSRNLLKDSVKSIPPFSFPGKLLTFLYQRFKHFNGASDKGMVIVSTELTGNNAEILEAIVLELAHLNNLEPAFLDWIENSNHFCNK